MRIFVTKCISVFILETSPWMAENCKSLFVPWNKQIERSSFRAWTVLVVHLRFRFEQTFEWKTYDFRMNTRYAASKFSFVKKMRVITFVTLVESFLKIWTNKLLWQNCGFLSKIVKLQHYLNSSSRTYFTSSWISIMKAFLNPFRYLVIWSSKEFLFHFG